MMSVLPKEKISPEEYLAMERAAPYKSEYFNGEMFAMAGASRRHNLIALNTASELRAQLKKTSCEVYVIDMRVKVAQASSLCKLSHMELYTYPDVTVVCGKPQFDDRYADTLLNPLLIVEVLSKSTAAYDRGAKFEQYRTLASLCDYLLISQERCYAEHYVRQPGNTWLLSEYRDLEDVIVLESIGCELKLREIYDRVSLLSVNAIKLKEKES
ncbi:MAG: Uma2 family endonuclease [Desulfococcaceae bacterium]